MRCKRIQRETPAGIFFKSNTLPSSVLGKVHLAAPLQTASAIKNGAPPEGKRAGGNDGPAPPCRPVLLGNQKWYSALTIGVLAEAPGTRLLSLPNLLCQY